MNKKIDIQKLNPKTIDILRDMAVKLETEDLRTAYELMSLAYIARPNGGFIMKKVEEYHHKLFALTPEELILKEKIKSGEVAIIPIGFRCFTRMKFIEKVHIQQESLIFDSGFFPPVSVVSVLKNPKINLDYKSSETQTVCIKHENHIDSIYGKGIKFQKSNYEEINSIASNKEVKNLKIYLDSHFGYYTLDLKHKFVLSHFNWHKLADEANSKGITDPLINLRNINIILNRRVKRMFEKCNNAKYIFFIHLENQGYNYMMIDDEKFKLNDFQEIIDVANDIFDAKVHLLDVNKLNGAKEILQIIV